MRQFRVFSGWLVWSVIHFVSIYMLFLLLFYYFTMIMLIGRIETSISIIFMLLYSVFFTPHLMPKLFLIAISSYYHHNQPFNNCYLYRYNLKEVSLMIQFSDYKFISICPILLPHALPFLISIYVLYCKFSQHFVLRLWVYIQLSHYQIKVYLIIMMLSFWYVPSLSWYLNL